MFINMVLLNKHFRTGETYLNGIYDRHSNLHTSFAKSVVQMHRILLYHVFNFRYICFTFVFI